MRHRLSSHWNFAKQFFQWLDHCEKSRPRFTPPPCPTFPGPKFATAAPTKKSAEAPSRFFFVSQPRHEYIAVPEVSSERRTFIPIAYLPARVIASNKPYVIDSPDLYLFGLLSSRMHMAWVQVVAGRLESRYQYSASMVYNTFPWPNASKVQKEKIRPCAQAVLDARARHLPPREMATLADLYDPSARPVELVKAINVSVCLPSQTK